MHHQRKNAPKDTLEMLHPNNRINVLGTEGMAYFNYLKGESVYLFDNLYKPEDLFGDRIVPFKRRAGQQVEDRIVPENFT